jgi:retinol dehydrogenase-12
LKTAVITGANTGVGRATAEALAATHALILLCRDAVRAQPVLTKLKAEGATVRCVPLDLGSLDSVRAAAATLAGEPIDLLINNAGVGGARGQTTDGFELAFGTNYLGHYLLTRRLLPQLTSSARVIHLGSGSHARVQGVDLDRCREPTRTITGIEEYGVSKLAQMRFHHALTERGVMSLVADPGDVASDAYRHLPCVVRSLWTARMKSPAQGAHATVFCATSPHVQPGEAFVDARRFSLAPSAEHECQRLWDASATWVGLPS